MTGGGSAPLISLDAVFEELQAIKDSVSMRGVDPYEIGWRHGVGQCIDAIAHRFVVEDRIIPPEGPS